MGQEESKSYLSSFLQYKKTFNFKITIYLIAICNQEKEQQYKEMQKVVKSKEKNLKI